MPLYKFYRIVPKTVENDDCYIGHTIQPLRKRFTGHYDDYKRKARCGTHTLFEKYGRDGLEIVLIHELELPDKEYARREERRLYEENTVINKRRPWISDVETQQYNKQYNTAYGKERRNRESALKYLRKLLE